MSSVAGGTTSMITTTNTQAATPDKDTVEAWFRPAWWTVTSKWLHEELCRAGLERHGPVQVVKVRPWAAVWRIPTSGGIVYLKAGAASQRHEAALVNFLATAAPRSTVNCLATDEDAGLLLMRDAGPTLSDTATGNLSRVLPHLEQALTRMARLQRNLIPHADRLLALGVPDRRPEHLAGQTAALLTRPDLSVPDDPLSLQQHERQALHDLLPAVAQLGQHLAAGPVPASLEHGDLYDHHIIVNADGIAFLDWGDAALTHPFVVVMPLFQQLMDRHSLATDDPVFGRLRAAYLEPWQSHTTAGELERLLDVALVASRLNRPLSYVHALGAKSARLTPRMQRIYRHGIAEWLRAARPGLQRFSPPA